MSKTVDFSKFPNIALVEEIDDMGGSSVILHFQNGTKLHICPDNDAVSYTVEGDPLDGDGDNRVTILLDLDSGHHAHDFKNRLFLFPGKNIDVVAK